VDFEYIKEWIIGDLYFAWISVMVVMFLAIAVGLSGCATTRAPYDVEEETSAWTQECYYEGPAFREVPPEDCTEEGQRELASQPAFTQGLSEYERRVRRYDPRRETDLDH